MKNLKTRVAVLLLSTLCLSTSAYTQITPLGDAYTNSSDPATNYGSKTLLDVDGATQITYIQFNLLSIPTGASVSQATLKLYVNAVTTAGSFEVYAVNGAWTESKITYDLAPALGSVIDSGVALTTADKNQYILIPMTSTVQEWVNTPSSNNGIALVAIGSFNATFDSKENTTTSHPAELDVVFAGDGTVTSVGTGSGLTGGPITGSGTISLLTSCASGQILQWNGSSWVCSAAGTGTVTSVSSGTGLKGGPITGSGTLTADSTVVAFLGLENQFTASQNVNGTITATNLSASGTVSGASVAATGTVSGGELSSADTVNATNAFYLGGNPFAFGSYVYQNAYLGFAGNSNPGGDNTAAGYYSLPSNTTGIYNTSMGAFALHINTTGSNNTASGVTSLNDNTTGSNNTASGFDSLFFNGTGSYNTAIGFDAGQTSDESSMNTNNNTAVGAGAAFSTGTLQNATVIGSNAVVAESNALVLGCVSSVNSCTGSVNVGIGTPAPRSVLDVEADVPSGLGPTVTLTNNGGTGQVSLDFNTYQASTTGTYNPSSRILSADNGDYSDTIYFLANKVGAANNGLQDTMSIDSSGDVHVYGTLSKASGSFQIDHPLDPANKYLYHSFVESPDMKNIYDGVATLDAHGSVWITLPEYFEALNEEFRYQLTSIGRPQPSLYVAKEVSGNRFRISGGKPRGKVSWQVTGIRHDAYADAHRIRVEVEKPAQEQGRYLHPELFGAPAEQAIGYHAPPPGLMPEQGEGH
jgi:hypothetical protein